MDEYDNGKPQQIVIIEHDRKDFERRFYELREEGYRATQIATSQCPIPNNAPSQTFMALMDF